MSFLGEGKLLLQFSKGQCKKGAEKVQIYSKETDAIILWIRTALGLSGYQQSDVFTRQEVPPSRYVNRGYF